jgi:hypothetical protein
MAILGNKILIYHKSLEINFKNVIILYFLNKNSNKFKKYK